MTDSPPVNRLAAPSWLDVRLVLGVLLVLVSIVVGARVLASADETQPVWVTTRDLAPGSTLDEGDLERKRVRLFDQADRYAPAPDGSAPPTGYVLLRGLGADELLPRAAIRMPQDEPELREVAVPVEPQHLPQDLQDGQLVDVYVTIGETLDVETSAAPAPSPRATLPLGTQLVLTAVPVRLRSYDDGLGGDGASVVLSVTADEAAQLVAALRQGPIDLVRVPRDSEVDRLADGDSSQPSR